MPLSTLIIIIASATLLAAAIGWLIRMLTDYPPKRIPSTVLSAREQTTLAAAADAFFPPGGPIPISGSDAGVVRYFDGYVGRYRPAQRLLTRLLIAFTEYSPLLFGPRHVRFSRLALEQRIAFLNHAFTSSVYFRRIAFITLRAVMTMAYLSNREVARHMNMTCDTDPFGIGEGALEVMPGAHTANAAGAAA